MLDVHSVASCLLLPRIRTLCRKYQLIYTYGNVYQTGGLVSMHMRTRQAASAGLI